MSTRLAFIVAALSALIAFCAWAPETETASNHPGIFRLTGDGRIDIVDVETGENLSIVYRDSAGRYDVSTIAAVDRVLRCHGAGEMYPMSLKLIEFVDHLQDRFGAAKVRVVSGYRSPEYNAALKRKLGRVAHASLHMRGMAMDIQLPGVGKEELGRYARALGAGGVGVYASSGFVHVDAGEVRSW